MVAAAVFVGVAIGYAALQQREPESQDESSDGRGGEGNDPARAAEPSRRWPAHPSSEPAAAAPAPAAPRAHCRCRASAPSRSRWCRPPSTTPRGGALKPVRDTPRVEERPAPTTVPEASLVFETRALVGTRKPKEHSAQLVLAEGKITIIPTSDPSTTLCAIPYGRVISINVSKSRDPLWNSPQGPAPVARAGGTLSKFGIAATREWISLRTSTDEQFVAMRFDEVIIKRVLLALEERTGHTPEIVVLPTEEDKGKRTSRAGPLDRPVNGRSHFCKARSKTAARSAPCCAASRSHQLSRISA